MRLRDLPSVDELARAVDDPLAVSAARTVLAAAREEIRAGFEPGDLAARVRAEVRGARAPALRRVLNATGILVHTNLGRAPLPDAALERVREVGRSYSNLEYDLTAGGRGSRQDHVAGILRRLTGAEAALVANNTAAATLLVLASLANGREVLVSRGELVEIGGGFRVPDVLAQSGARLREVGTTNRTRVSDYAAAIGDRTALILRVHPSNFRIEGFTERPALRELADLSHQFELPLFEDLGSGWLGTSEPIDALREEPTIAASLEAGADLVAFSGDKLLGGPQAGIVLGRRELIERIRRHPLMRAVRADKLTYAALEATLALWAETPSCARIPVVRMLTMSVDEIEVRARGLIAHLEAVPGLRAEIIDGFSTTGGGSAPGSALPTKLMAIESKRLSAAELDARLRGNDPPVVARIQDDRVVLDLRTVQETEDTILTEALARASGATAT
jgi:L-seryl-tRNA(Ser) seleniumtransferase